MPGQPVVSRTLVNDYGPRGLVTNIYVHAVHTTLRTFGSLFMSHMESKKGGDDYIIDARPVMPIVMVGAIPGLLMLMSLIFALVYYDPAPLKAALAGFLILLSIAAFFARFRLVATRDTLWVRDWYNGNCMIPLEEVQEVYMDPGSVKRWGEMNRPIVGLAIETSTREKPVVINLKCFNSETITRLKELLEENGTPIQ